MVLTTHSDRIAGQIVCGMSGRLLYFAVGEWCIVGLICPGKQLQASSELAHEATSPPCGRHLSSHGKTKPRNSKHRSPSAQWLVACPVFVKLCVMRYFTFWLWLGLTAPILGAEIKIDFSDFATGQSPTGFHSALA